MGFDLDVRPFLAGLAGAAKGMELAGERAVSGTGDATGQRAAALAPVESGELRSSMRVTEGRDGAGYFVEVAFDADHAAENEFGTSTMDAKPFLRPALAEAAADFARRIP